jgi:hypothetical protein
MNRPGMTHICLEVSDIEQLTQRLRAPASNPGRPR